MGQSFSISSKLPLTPLVETSTALDESATGDYQNLLQSFLDSEIQAVAQPPVEKKETLFDKIFTTAKSEPLIVLKQQTSDKLRGAEQRLISIQNSAIRASTNTTSLSKGLKETFTANADLQNTLKQGLKKAYAMGGGNLGLVSSYNKSLSGVKAYLTIAQKLNLELIHSLDLLSRIESTTDLTYAEIEGDSNTFLDSIDSQNYVNQFVGSKKMVRQLIETIQKNEPQLAKFSKQIKPLIIQLESRSDEIKKYFSEPKPLNLALKNSAEFTKEYETIAANLNMLNLNLLLLPTFSKTIQSIISQLKGLETFVNELEEMNLAYVKNQTSQQTADKLSSQSYNGFGIEKLQEAKQGLITAQMQKV